MMHSAKNSDHLRKVRHVMKSGGYTTGKQNHSMKKIAKEVADKEIHKHEKHEYSGKLTKLKDGGHAHGVKAHVRLDKRKRGGGKHHTSVNVIVPQASGARPMPVPVPAAGAPMAPRPPVPPAPPPGAPMGGGAPMNPMMQQRPPMKKGGVPHLDAGAASGKGRLEKIEIEKKFVGKNKKRGGGCS